MAEKPDTPLIRYRKGKGMTLEVFARKLGKTKGHMSIVERDMRCSATLALDIERETGGAISASQLNPDVAMVRAA